MQFTERIKQLREKRQMPQRQFAAATYCKIEKGERRVKVEQVVIIADLLKTDKDELLALWLADQVTAVVADEKKVADKALNIAKHKVNQK